MTLAELLALYARLTDLTEAELTQLADGLAAAAEERRGQPITDDLLAELTQIADAAEGVRAEEDTRAAANADRDAAAQAALDRVNAALGEDPEPELEAPPVEGDPPAEPPAVEAEPATPEGAEPVPVAAAAAPAPRAPRVSRVNARRPASMQIQPPATPEVRPLNLVASANVPGFAAGEVINDAGKLADVFEAGIQSFRGYTGNDRTKVRLVRSGDKSPEAMDLLFGSERYLDSNTGENMRKINRARAQLRNGTPMADMTALSAAGGICIPQQVRYDLPIIGDDARPIRDQALMRFGADRGGIETIAPPVIEDLEDAITVWTEANDRDPSAPTTKGCLEVDCPASDDTLVDAIVQCLRFGNFRARYFAEQIEAWMRLAAVNHARIAENRSLTTMAAGSKDITTAEGLGALSDVLSALDRAWAGWASRHRAPTQEFRVVLPFWFLAMARVDVARQMPFGTLDERYAVADSTIESFFNARPFSVTWHFDGEAGQIFTPQGDGPLIGWPDTVVAYLYEEGAWLFLDGGELNLGLVRDSTLNATNDVQVFSETFEATHFHGVDSYRIEMDVCPNGTAAGLTTFSPCSTGS